MYMDKIFTGIQLGLFIILSIYALGTIFNKRMIWMRTWMIILAAVFVTYSYLPFRYYQAPDGYLAIDLVQAVKIICMTLLLVIILASTAHMLHLMLGQLTGIYLAPKIQTKLRQIFFTLGLLAPVAILILTPIRTVLLFDQTIGHCLSASIGLWIVLRLTLMETKKAPGL